MNLEEIKEFLESEQRLDEVRAAYRAKRDVNTKAARLQQKELLEEALELNESLKEQLDAKLARMDSFRATLAQNADRCRQLLIRARADGGRSWISVRTILRRSLR